ncbi:peroxisomal membrane anchor protein conserved region-domain-containing protein, partial [Spinellus fusiger]
MREDLITSAISFLSDPKVQSAPLAKKVSFLESKGMTSEEIEEAMARANGKSTGTGGISGPTAATVAVGGPVGRGVQSLVPPPVPARPAYDWRDVFIAAVLASGVGYGVWRLAKTLLGPWFKVPTQKELEEDKDKLDAQFQAVEDSLKEIKTQTNEALKDISSQSEKINESMKDVQQVCKDLKQGEDGRENELNNIKKEMLDRNKESQSVILNDLQNEVKSLKSLLLSRRPTGSPSVLDPTSPLETTPTGLSSRLSAAFNSTPRAGIPSWQMAATKPTPSTTESQASESSKEE